MAANKERNFDWSLDQRHISQHEQQLLREQQILLEKLEQERQQQLHLQQQQQQRQQQLYQQQLNQQQQLLGIHLQRMSEKQQVSSQLEQQMLEQNSQTELRHSEAYNHQRVNTDSGEPNSRSSEYNDVENCENQMVSSALAAAANTMNNGEIGEKGEQYIGQTTSQEGPEDATMSDDDNDTLPGEESEQVVEEFKCDQCGKEFLKKKSLDAHKRSHKSFRLTTKRSPTNKCEICGRAFTRADHLKRHLLTHSGDRPHVCSVCERAFARRDKMAHEKRHK